MPDLLPVIDRVERVLASHRQPLRVDVASGGLADGGVHLRLTGRVRWSSQLLLDLALATGARAWEVGLCDGCTTLYLC